MLPDGSQLAHRATFGAARCHNYAGRTHPITTTFRAIRASDPGSPPGMSGQMSADLLTSALRLPRRPPATRTRDPPRRVARSVRPGCAHRKTEVGLQTDSSFTREVEVTSTTLTCWYWLPSVVVIG